MIIATHPANMSLAEIEAEIEMIERTEYDECHRATLARWESLVEAKHARQDSLAFACGELV